ncbi:hypothetical protein SAMN05421636_105425 [Pricia antarctica]|uniref:Uncharacterized protein n=1 Tax=Pricia antarctica TaxID=641691 RepID=A0A1G7DSC6_9FLAO|nr:hypothetical protein SAMN05421636_105425 [Pricia antarctica]
MRPMEFLLHANLPESLQKFHRIHAQVSMVRFGRGNNPISGSYCISTMTRFFQRASELNNIIKSEFQISLWYI